jgi:hypothetical protein
MKKKLIHIPLMILGGIGIAFLMCLALMYLWNWLMPELFHLPTITFWQALGLFILSRFLFGGMKYHGKSHMKRDKCDDIWHTKFEEKLASLRPDEKEKFKETWKKHFENEPVDHSS